MGEHANYQIANEMRRGSKSKFWDGKPIPRNPVADHCPHCGKGIRPVAGLIDESMAAHIKAKRCDLSRKEPE